MRWITSALIVGYVVWLASIAYIVYHFLVKYW